MADETDFIDLYARLRVEPGCTLAEFKQAYRRHVAAWHPDRRRGGRADAIAAARLQRLTVQYGAAMEFHRRHGRLPGAAIAPRATPPLPEVMELDESVADETAGATRESVSARPSRRTLSVRWWLLTAAVGVAILAWSLLPSDESADEGNAGEAAIVMPAARGVTAPTPNFTLGSSESEVLAIEGEPTRRDGDRWEYGPSWVRFENDTVVDWYSSPLRGLHVTTPRGSP